MVSLLFKGKEWDPIIKAMELISQIEEYKAEDLNSTSAN